jgi:hypothetical protein
VAVTDLLELDLRSNRAGKHRLVTTYLLRVAHTLSGMRGCPTWSTSRPLLTPSWAGPVVLGNPRNTARLLPGLIPHSGHIARQSIDSAGRIHADYGTGRRASTNRGSRSRNLEHRRLHIELSFVHRASPRIHLLCYCTRFDHAPFVRH